MPDLMDNIDRKNTGVRLKTDNRELINSLSRLSGTDDILAKLRRDGITKQKDIVKLLKDMISYGKGSFVIKNIHAFCIVDQNDLVDLCNRVIEVKLGSILIDNLEGLGILL